ncbi:hypothetical protein ACFL5O_09725 [Myxococcota bacterium]
MKTGQSPVTEGIWGSLEVLIPPLLVDPAAGVVLSGLIAPPAAVVPPAIVVPPVAVVPPAPVGRAPPVEPPPFDAAEAPAVPVVPAELPTTGRLSAGSPPLLPVPAPPLSTLVPSVFWLSGCNVPWAETQAMLRCSISPTGAHVAGSPTDPHRIR